MNVLPSITRIIDIRTCEWGAVKIYLLIDMLLINLSQHRMLTFLKVSIFMKFMTIEEYANELEKSDEYVKARNEAFEKMKQLREESPARYERKYHIDLMNLDQTFKLHCSCVAFSSPALQQPCRAYENNDESFDDEEFENLYAYVKENCLKAADAASKLDALIAQLDQAVIEEDERKLAT